MSQNELWDDVSVPASEFGEDSLDDPDGKGDLSDSYQLRCPSCKYIEQARSRAFLASRQQSEPCPNCNRMLALSRCRE